MCPTDKLRLKFFSLWSLRRSDQDSSRLEEREGDETCVSLYICGISWTDAEYRERERAMVIHSGSVGLQKNSPWKAIRRSADWRDGDLTGSVLSQSIYTFYKRERGRNGGKEGG